MGYDITFHLISEQELQHFVFDVIADPNLGPQRVLEITDDPKKRFHLANVYQIMGEMANDLQSGRTSFPFAYPYAASIIAGYLHPYWYSRNLWIGMILYQTGVLFPMRSIVDLWPGFQGLQDPSQGVIQRNFSGGGYVKPENMDKLKVKLKANSQFYAEAGKDDVNAMFEAIQYGEENNLGLIEVADVVVPMSGEVSSDEDNLRAYFMKGKSKGPVKAIPALPTVYLSEQDLPPHLRRQR